MTYFKVHKRTAIAFSGGVDSSLLVRIAADSLGSCNVTAVTCIGLFFPERNTKAVCDFCNNLGVRLILVKPSMLDDSRVRQNGSDRCYYCKKMIFEAIQNALKDADITVLAEGTNQDDMHDHRPGFKAVRESGVYSPYLDCGVNKYMIRELARELDIKQWNQPSSACLAACIPTGTPITAEALQKIEAAEIGLLNLGFIGMRIRYHGQLARIEFRDSDSLQRACTMLRQSVINVIKNAGFEYVTVDLEGYQPSGSRQQSTSQSNN